MASFVVGEPLQPCSAVNVIFTVEPGATVVDDSRWGERRPSKGERRHDDSGEDDDASAAVRGGHDQRVVAIAAGVPMPGTSTAVIMSCEAVRDTLSAALDNEADDVELRDA